MSKSLFGVGSRVLFFRGENQKGGNFNRGTVKLGQNKDMTGGGFKSMFYIHLQILDRWGVMESNFDLRIFLKMCWEWEKNHPTTKNTSHVSKKV